MRAFLVGLLVATPALLLGSVADSIEIAVLLAIIFSVVTFLEYNTNFPSFVEFREAPPINRIRFIALFAMVFLVSIVAKHMDAPTSLTGLVFGVGNMVGSVLDFPYSPVRMVLLVVPDSMSAQALIALRSAAGLAAIVALIAGVAFLGAVRIYGWPVASGAFNVWVNLPLFDPTTGSDVVWRLQRDARVNIIIGALLPFLLPALARMAFGFGTPPAALSPHVLIWSVSIWAFLPISLIIRGMALQRIAELIEAKRQRAYASAEHLRTV